VPGAQEILRRMQQNSPTFRYSQPTATQLANDPRMGALHRYLLSKDPLGYGAQFSQRTAQQNASRVGAVEAAGGTQAAVDAARDARRAASDFYKPGRDMDLDLLFKSSGPYKVLTNAMHGQPLGMVPRAKAELDAATKAIQGTDGGIFNVYASGQRLIGARQTIDDVLRGNYQGAPAGEIGRGYRAAAEVTLEKLRESINRTLHSRSPVIKKYDEVYAEGSKKVNANAALLKILGKASTSATQDGVETFAPGPLRAALRSLSKQEVKDLGPDNIKLLTQLKKELQLATEAVSKARQPNSPTHSLGEFDANLPAGLRLLMGAGSQNGMVGTAANMLTRNAGPRAMSAMGDRLMDPQSLEKALRTAIGRNAKNVSDQELALLTQAVGPLLAGQR
jgi:hypothetical protein